MRLGEGDAKQSDDVTIGGSAIDRTFDDRLLLTDQGAQLITGHIHTVEVQKTVVSLYVFDAKLNFSPCQGFILVQIGQGNLYNTSLKVIGSDFGTLSLCDQSAAAILGSKD